MYQFPSYERLFQIEEEMFSSYFSIDNHGRRIYDSINSAEKAHSELQISEMKRYALEQGVDLDRIKDTQILIKICSAWVERYAYIFSQFWQSTHKKISNNKT